jgi:enoyl-CoA hydratase/carnithine racemase
MNSENPDLAAPDGRYRSTDRNLLRDLITAAHEGLRPAADGRPGLVLYRVDLDRWHEAGDAEVARAADAVTGMLPLVVGVAHRTPPERLTPLLNALAFTLAGPAIPCYRRELVPATDPDAAYGLLVSALDESPRAGLALGHLLRRTARADTVPGLAAEAAVYSMLLGGPEFARWRTDRDPVRPAGATGRPLVRVTREGRALSVELDHPARRNALSARMREELYGALEAALGDPGIERVSVRGAGPAFCSGGDLAEFGMADDPVAAYMVRLDRAPWRLIDALRDKVCVRVHGAVVGAGLEIAAFAGHVSASQDTRFRLPELSMGLVPGAGGTVSVTRRIGRWRTAWLALTGQELDAATSLRWGLVDEVRDPAPTPAGDSVSRAPGDGSGTAGRPGTVRGDT